MSTRHAEQPVAISSTTSPDGAGDPGRQHEGAPRSLRVDVAGAGRP